MVEMTKPVDFSVSPLQEMSRRLPGWNGLYVHISVYDPPKWVLQQKKIMNQIGKSTSEGLLFHKEPDWILPFINEILIKLHFEFIQNIFVECYCLRT